MDVKELIGEATEYDKKQALEEKKPKSWCKSVSAFANTFGGALFFGISDAGEFVGLQDPEGDAEKISEIIKNRLNPVPEFRLRFHKENEKVAIVLDIYKGEETPYYYAADGVFEAYVRIGNESVKTTSEELKRLVLRGKNTSYDSQNSMYKVEDFAYSKLRAKYKKWTGNSFEEKDLLSFGLANEAGYLTNAGALLADESPIRCSRLFCTRWNGLNKSGGTVNALAHRDYLVNGSEVHIDIYDDRMEIYSPGGMPDGSYIQERDPLTVPSTRRNPVLADVFNRLGYMERKGSGFGKIIGGYEFQVNYSEDKKPSFRSDRYQFTVIMPNLNYGVDNANGIKDTNHDTIDTNRDTNDLETRLLNCINENAGFTQKVYAEMLNVSVPTIKRLFARLQKENVLKREGTNRKGQWIVIKEKKL